MCAKMAFTHQPGTAMECLSVSINYINDKKKIEQVFSRIANIYSGWQVYDVFIFNNLPFQIPITLTKESAMDTDGRELLKCGFKIGGGIDQDFLKSPQGYTDNVNNFQVFNSITLLFNRNYFREFM